MSEITKPDYIHFSRVKTISGDEAQWLLANFEINDSSITNKDEYNLLYNKELSTALRVLTDALNDKAIMYEYVDYPFDFDPDGTKWWYLGNITIKTIDFCIWALNNKYKLPEELAALAASSSVAETDQKKEGSNGTTTEQKEKKAVPPISDNTKTVDGLLKMVIAMAMDVYGYDPADSKSTTTSDIMNALAKCGLYVSENTIRERLKQAQLHLPRDPK